MPKFHARTPLAVAISLLIAASAQASTLDAVDLSLATVRASDSGALSAPRLQLSMRALPAAYDAKRLDPEAVARAHLDQMLARQEAGKATSERFELQSVSPMRGGAQIVQFKRSINGIEVFREDVGMLIDAGQRLVAFRGRGTLLQPTLGKSAAFALSGTDAAAIALSGYGYEKVNVLHALQSREAAGDYQWYAVDGSLRSAAGAVLRQPLRVKPVYFPHAGRGLVPAYYVETQVQPSDAAAAEYYAHVVSAVDGEVLFRHFQQADGGATPFNYRVWAEPAPLGLPQPSPYGRNDQPHPTGSAAFTPSFVAPSLVTMANAPFSMNDPWLPAAAAESTGNNVEAYADFVAPDGFNAGSDLRATTTAAQTFDRVYNTAAEPGVSNDQRMAAVTQQFYWINWLHDDYYDAGFAEVDGNAQNDNYGRGGLAADSIMGEGQDNGGTNNANMSTPADGGRPRMQMFLWSPVAPHTLTVNAVDYANGTASFGAQSFDLTDDVVRAVPNDGCVALTNGAQVSGKVAFVDRGTCAFTVKVKNAQDAGAVGVVIGNVASSPNPATPPGMGGTDATVTIGAMSVNLADGDVIRTQLGDANPDTARLFRGTGVGRDGTIDGAIIAHEWGHYISNRLVSNASGLSNQKGRGMGEGWADFHALLSMVKAEDAAAGVYPDFSDSYSIAAYVSGDAMYGIRRYPYSTRMTTVNPLSFRHTVDGVALPANPAPKFGADGATNSEVHNTGEVWTAMLWECYAGMLQDTLGAMPRLTFAQARERMKEYVVAGYKLTPSAPTMTEARDAILAAIVANDTDDFALCAAGFAKRGLGILAVDAPRDSTTNAGAVEDFTVGGDLAAVSAAADDDSNCDNDGYLDLNEDGALQIDVRNIGWTSLVGGTVSVTANHAGLQFPSGNSVALAASTPYTTQVVNLPIHLTSVPGSGVVQFVATPTEGTILNPPGAPVTLNARVAANEFAAASATETFDAINYGWTTALGNGAGPSFAWYRSGVDSAGGRFAIGPDSGAIGTTSLVSMPIQVGAGTFTITLTHRYSFEADTTFWDGGIIEISTDGNNWTSIGGATYDGAINGGAAAGNPLNGQNAYIGNSPGYPANTVDTINLGSTYANQAVQLRFTIGTDAGVGAPGWELHTVALSGTDTPFATVASNSDACLAPGELVFRNSFE